jgi:hypothetical protein
MMHLMLLYMKNDLAGAGVTAYDLGFHQYD